nr:outer membrane beta-barrel protein [Bacteroidota bacterium]
MPASSCHKALFIILLFFVPEMLSAQQFKPGFIIGGNICEIEGLPTGSYFGHHLTKFGFLVGASVRTEVHKKINMELQLRYIQLGMRKPMNPHWNDYTSWNLTLDYLQIPVFANIMVYEDFSISPGLSYGRLFGLRYKDPFLIMAETLRDIRSFKKNDVSALLYVNYSITPVVLAFVGASHSLMPINTDAEERILSPFRFNRGFYNLSFQFGVRLHLM